MVVQVFCFCGRYFKRFITGHYVYVGADVFVYGGDVSLSPSIWSDPFRSLSSKPNYSGEDWRSEADEYGVSKRFVKRKLGRSGDQLANPDLLCQDYIGNASEISKAAACNEGF